MEGDEREQASGQDEGTLLLLAGLDRRLEAGDRVVPLGGGEPKRSQPGVVEGQVDTQSAQLGSAEPSRRTRSASTIWSLSWSAHPSNKRAG